MGVIIFPQFFSFLKNVFVMMCVCFFGGFRVSGVSLIGWWNWVWNGDAFDFEYWGVHVLALLNYSYDDRLPFFGLLIVLNKRSLKDLIFGKFTNIACKFFLTVCLHCYFKCSF